MRPAELFYQIVDKAVAKAFDPKEFPCKKGCYWCCYLSVDCCPEEAIEVELGIRQLGRDTRKKIYRQEKRWRQVHGDSYVDSEHLRDQIQQAIFTQNAGAMEVLNKLWEKLLLEHLARAVEKKAPCPYLLDGNCAVYQHRPASCRDSFPEAGKGGEDCLDPDTAISQIEFKWLVGVGRRVGVDFMSQGRLVDQVREARKSIN